MRAASSSDGSSWASDAELDRNTSGRNRTKYASGMIQKVPISTCPRLNALPVLNAEIRLIATTVPGSAQAIMTRCRAARGR